MIRITALAAVCSLSLFICQQGYAEERSARDPEAETLKKIVAKTVRAPVLRIDGDEESPISGIRQVRVWVQSPYGETPVLFYKTADGKFFIAGTVYDATGESITAKTVGESIPKRLDDAQLGLNEDYLIGKKGAPVRAVLWIGPDRYSKQLFEMWYELYGRNREKIALYIKFYTAGKRDIAKLKALTCFQKERFTDALKVMYEAVPGWGSDEDLKAFRKTGDAAACKDSIVDEDLSRARELGLPAHAVTFVNGLLFLENPTRENVSKLTGVAVD